MVGRTHFTALLLLLWIYFVVVFYLDFYFGIVCQRALSTSIALFLMR